MPKKLLIGVFLFSVILLNSFSSVLAVVVFTISDPVVGADDEIEVNASIAGLISSSCSTGGCYLQAQIRVADESKNFFGYTYNNSGEFIDYFSKPSSTDEIKTKLFNFVPTSGGAWSGKIRAKNNITDPNYIGPGQYTLKFRRFSGNSISPTSGDSNTISILLAAATPSPTPTPLPSPTPSPTPTLSPTQTPIKTPTSTPTPTPIPIKTPSPTPTKSPSPTPTESPTEESTSTSNPTPGATVLAESTEKRSSILPYVLIAAGISCLGFAGYSLYNIKK